MTHENNNIGGGAEHRDSDEQKISQLLGELKRVEAPRDFDFHLKARTANGRAENPRPASLFPILKYAMPLALFMFAGVGVLLFNSYNAGPNMVDVQPPAGITSDSQPAAATTAPAAVVKATTTPLPDAPSSTQIASQPRTPNSPSAESPRSNTGPKVTSPGSVDFPRRPTSSGNYIDRALIAAPTPRSPRGMEQNAIGVAEAFQRIDADAGFDGGWKIKAVKANGIADQIGLKAGDLLKTINGKAVSEGTQFQNSFTVSTIQVQRGDSTVELSASSKPKQ